MADQAQFFERNAEFFEDGVWEDDDQRTDVMALIVLDPVPVEVSTRPTSHATAEADYNALDHQHAAQLERRRLWGRTVLVAGRQIRESA